VAAAARVMKAAKAAAAERVLREGESAVWAARAEREGATGVVAAGMHALAALRQATRRLALGPRRAALTLNPDGHHHLPPPASAAPPLAPPAQRCAAPPAPGRGPHLRHSRDATR
jgi:hypothetical protein